MYTAIGLLSLYNGAIQVRIIVVGAILVLFLDRDKFPFVSRVVSGVCSSAPARFAANVSYSTYLLHNMLLYPILLMLKQANWFTSLNLYLQQVCAFVIIGVPVVSLSYLLFRFIERPGIAMGRKLSPVIVDYARSKYLVFRETLSLASGVGPR
jgi:peptidoglycan/LPS O-acetylase OafA/YrhL